MKKLLFIATLFVSNFCFSQARELGGYDTVIHRFGLIYKDTLKTIQADSPIVITTVSPYLLKLSLSAGFLGGTWTASTLYPTKMYAGIGTNTYTKVGIGTDTPRAPLQIKSPIAANTACDSCGILLSNDSASTSGNQIYSPPLTFQGNGYSTPGAKTIRFREYLVPVQQASIWPNASLYWDYLNSNVWANVMKLNITGGGGALSTSLNVGGTLINDPTSGGNLGNGNSSNYLIIANTNGNSGVKIIGGSTNYFFRGSTTVGGLFQYANNASTGLAINDLSSATYSDSKAILDLQSASKGLLIPRMKSNQRDTLTSAIFGTLSITNAGSGYTNGSYISVVCTALTGVGINAKLSFTVAGGVITVAQTNFGNQYTGTGFNVGDQLTVPALGGSGSGGIVTVTSVSTAPRSLMIQDTSVNQLSVHNTANSWTGKVATDSLATKTLDYGDDFIAIGTNAKTYTLPAILTNTTGRQNGIKIKNRGSGTITLNAASGSTIYDTAAQSTISITAGQACELLPDGTYFNVMFKL